MADTFSEADLKGFDAIYRTDREAKALRARGLFIEAFPAKSLATLKLKDYVIGLQKPTFCTFVEVTTRYWARITGATAFKFGVYFGKTKFDSKKEYRFAEKYGSSVAAAFKTVGKSLVNLVEEGAKNNPDFQLIEENQLSPMFKAKILSLYFPSKFINICSKEHLRDFAKIFKLPNKIP